MNSHSFSERAQRAIAECRRIAAMSEEPERITRRFLTSPVREVHALLGQRMEALGMTVSVDAAGNLRGFWQPPNAHGKRFILGSHIDTVPNAGAFDGILGVTMALECVEIAQELALKLPTEIIAFSEEEGVRFGVPFIGSRALAGRFDPALLKLKDADGVTLENAIRAFGLDPGEIGKTAIDNNVLGFLEIHVEQGPVLDAENLSLAVVEGIVGQTRMGFRFTGVANHAGTTPMHLRHDALAGAAEWITKVESFAKSQPGLVATVGKIEGTPNAGNVIPGQIDLSLDLRHMSNRTRHWAIQELTAESRACAQARGVAVEWLIKLDQVTVPLDHYLMHDLDLAVEAAGFPSRRMTSGAGHDAMVMAARVPAAMLFLRSPGGISHHPDETVREEDVTAALAVCDKFLRRLAAEVG